MIPHAIALSPIVAGMQRLQQWGLDTPGLVRWVEQALELGVTSFDHADVYGGYTVEALFGQALAAAPGLREKLQIITKCGVRLPSSQRPANDIKSYDSSRAHVLASVDESLRALRTDRIDLLLLHRPDLLLAPDELAETFRVLLAAGKVLHFGVAQHATAEVAMLRKRHPLAAHQIEFSALQPRALDDGTLTQCVDLALRPLASSPLAGGRLFNGFDDDAARVRTALQELAWRHGASIATLAYAWILRHPARPIPVTGSGRTAALREATAALGLTLSAEDWYRVWQAASGRELT